MAESIPSPKISIFNIFNSSISYLFHCMTVLFSIFAFSIGTILYKGELLMMNPPTCCDRCLGNLRFDCLFYPPIRFYKNFNFTKSFKEF